MDAFDDESQVPDSQATQLIDHLLNPENRSEGDLRPAPSKSNSNLAVTDSALGSPLNLASFPNYHFHGLANTQSLSPACSLNTHNGVLHPAAQKENLNTSDKDTAHPQLPPPSPSRASVSAPSKASSKVVPTIYTSAHSPSKPGLSAHQFNRSRLNSGHSDSLDHLESGRDNPASKTMPPYSSWARNGLSRSTSLGVVLVESTPSNSSQSQSQSLSQQDVETQPLNPSQDPELVGRPIRSLDRMDDGKDDCSSSSSSFDRLLESPTLSQRFVATQPLNPSQDPEIVGYYHYNRYTSSQEYVATQPLNPSQDPELVGRPVHSLNRTDDGKDGYSSSSSSFNRLLESPVPSQQYVETQPLNPSQDPEWVQTQPLNPSQDPELVGLSHRTSTQEWVQTQPLNPSQDPELVRHRLDTSSQSYVETQPLRPSQDPELAGHPIHTSSQGWVETQPLNPSQDPELVGQSPYSPSQEYVATQPLKPSQDPDLVGRRINAPHLTDDGNDGYNSSSSSFNRPLKSPVSSPILELTQPAAQVDDLIMNVVSDHPLINMLPAHKRARYELARPASGRRMQILENSNTSTDDPASNSGVTHTSKDRMFEGRSEISRTMGCTSAISMERSALNSTVRENTDVEETHSCGSEEDVPSQASYSPNKRSAGSYRHRRKVRRLTCSPSPPPPAQPRRVDVDLMEIIPDSDPMQEYCPEESFSRKSHPKRVDSMRVSETETARETVHGVRAMAQTKERREIKRREEEEEDVEGDKDDEGEDDDDDDVPLASKRLSKNKTSKANVANEVKKKGKPTTVARRVTRGKKPRSSVDIEDSSSKGKGKQTETTSVRSSGIESPGSELVEPSTSLPERNEILKKGRRPRIANGQNCASVIPDKEVAQLGEGAVEPDHVSDMDVDDVKPGTSSRKRKRTNTKKSCKTPVVRQSERLRFVTSTVAAEEGKKGGTRVFALWRSDGQFYAARVLSHAGGDVFDLAFEDGSASSVSVSQMRSFSLRVGDEVLVGESCQPVEVVGLEHEAVKVKNAGGNVESKKYSEIRIAGKYIDHHWKDRIVLMDAIVTAKELIKGKASATPVREAVALTASKLTSSILEGTCIILSMSVSNDNGVSEKLSLITSIETARGCVVDDFSCLLRMEGKHIPSLKRWTINKEDVEWIGSAKIKRLFLVSDDASQKPKYLMALALGVPCLSKDWVEDCVHKKEKLKWLGYTLPQGYSLHLRGKVSQQVNIEWGESIRNLTGIMSNRVPCKLFTGWSVLLLGADMVPMPKGKCVKGVNEKSQEANNSLARIVLAMGADQVEAASEPKHVAHKFSYYDLIVIRDEDQYITDLPENTTVTWGWVKDCLIASRQLDRPNWGSRFHNLESSQEA